MCLVWEASAGSSTLTDISLLFRNTPTLTLVFFASLPSLPFSS
jgi:hypothetical protein